jgi:DNA-binding MarR family transcriptional regulator
MGWITDLLKEIPSAARYKAELEKLEAEHSILKSENTVLQSKLKTAEEKIGALEQKLSDRHTQDLPEIEVQMLTFIADTTDCTTDDLATHLRVSPQKILRHKDRLVELRYVDYGLTALDEEYYQLTPESRKLLDDKGIL